MNKKIFGLFSLAVAGLTVGFAISGASIAQADTTPPAASTCGLPVCDMDAAIAALRAGTEGSRFATISGFRVTYKNSKDLAVLQNLADFAVKAEAVLSEIYAGNTALAYVVREAHSLYGDVVSGLAMYSPLNATVLAGYYSQLSGDNSRFSVLLFWKGRISDFDDKDSLLALLDFFGKAESISRASGDSDYLAREAHGDQDTITARLVQIYPFYEGTYKIHVTCSIASGEDVPMYCQDGFINRLVIMDTMGGSGIQVSVANTETGTVMYSFTNVVLTGGGSTFEGQGSPSGVLSQLHVVLDHATGKVSGFIRNSDSLSTIQIDGQLQASPASVYDIQNRAPNASPLVADQLAGVYKGKYDGHAVSLSLVQFGAGSFGGTMSFDDQPNFKLRFQASRFYAKMGILVLVANTTSGAHVKLTAFFSQADKNGSFKVQGFGFTDLSGATQTLDLTSVAQH